MRLTLIICLARARLARLQRGVAKGPAPYIRAAQDEKWIAGTGAIRSGGWLRPPASVCGCPGAGRPPADGCCDGAWPAAACRAAPFGGVRGDGGVRDVAVTHRRLGGWRRDAVPPEHRGSRAG